MTITLSKYDLEVMRKAEELGALFEEVIFRTSNHDVLRLSWDFNGYDCIPEWWLKLDLDEFVSEPGAKSE